MQRTLRRYVLGGALILTVALFAACGDDDNANSNAPDGTAPTAANADATAEPTPEPERTPRTRPTPTPVADDGVILIVSGGEALYEPLRREFESLPQTAVTVGGTEYTGVSLVDLAEAAGVPDAAYATLEGQAPEGGRYIDIRLDLAESGADSILVSGETGNLRLVGGTLEAAQMATAVAAVDFIQGR